ncbi:MAG: YbhB/YbcL family Raf kinase inhibitor-like protein [Mariprofundaceae bacterium]
MRNLIASLVLSLACMLAASGASHGGEAMQIESSAFGPMGEIPSRHTCDGEDVSPPLAWSGIPAGAKSLVLIVDDPDAPDPAAPKMTWAHWLLYNLPPDSTGLPEAVPDSALPAGTLQGRNDWQRTGYGGPCPPIGRHRYFFRLYALDCMLPDLSRPDRKALLRAVEGHVLDQAELIGTYAKH